MITIVGGLLFLFCQPQCEPCLPDVYCPPCRSEEQYWIAGIAVILDAFLLAMLIINLRRIYTQR
jgi:hypothetical protein